MLKSLILVFLLIEVVFYICLGRHMHQLGASPVEIGALILLIAMLWRISHALSSFLVAAAMRWRDNRDLPLANSLTALASELEARFISYNWSQPFPGLALGSDPIGRRDGTPILLVHGFFSSRGMWVRFRERLAAANLGPIYTATMSPFMGSIEAMATSLEARMAEIKRETGTERIIIVAHSMGGLVTRAHMAKSGAGGICRFITLGSPHHGTKMAGLMPFECANQMRYGGAWIETLLDMEAASPPAMPTLSIYTLNDDLVYPPESSVLDWAENVPVSAVGHVALLFSESVTNRVIAAIRKTDAIT